MICAVPPELAPAAAESSPPGRETADTSRARSYPGTGWGSRARDRVVVVDFHAAHSPYHVPNAIALPEGVRPGKRRYGTWDENRRRFELIRYPWRTGAGMRYRNDDIRSLTCYS